MIFYIILFVRYGALVRTETQALEEVHAVNKLHIYIHSKYLKTILNKKHKNIKIVKHRVSLHTKNKLEQILNAWNLNLINKCNVLTLKRLHQANTLLKNKEATEYALSVHEYELYAL